MARAWTIGAGMALAALGFVAAAAEQAAAPAAAPVDARSRIGAGYLPAGSAPDSNLLIPPPPAAGSAALARDEEAQKAALALRGTPRWEFATNDALLFTPTATSTFSCAANLRIDAAGTPLTNALLRKAGPDLALAVYPTKRRFSRARPFTVNNQPTCTPSDEPLLRRDGSYPSGHSAIGYGWGLILAELLPDRSGQLVARGRAFGESRRVCNVHWLSDVEEGRVVATAVFARLHAEPAYRADLEAARKELEIQRLKKIVPPDCARENAALANG
jgi:acid phosphatase (class A)